MVVGGDGQVGDCMVVGDGQVGDCVVVGDGQVGGSGGYVGDSTVDR